MQVLYSLNYMYKYDKINIILELFHGRKLEKMKKVAYIASECVPFIKTGGLADVVGTLPKIFDRNEYDVRVIMPNYLCIPNKYREKMQYLTHFYMDIGYKNDYVGVMYLE